MPNDSSPLEVLEPSELGTKEYWDATYIREIRNYAEDPEDEGTIWFAESGAEEAILDVLDGLYGQGLIHRGTSSFLDVGTGNGHLLFALAEDVAEDDSTWSGRMIGVDYSLASIDLARTIAAQKQLRAVQFLCWDILRDSMQGSMSDGFDVVLDKGTFDAISLMPQDESENNSSHNCLVYRDKVLSLVKPGGFFCITSCNWTKQELIDWFITTPSELRLHSEAKYPSFTFGGQTGQSIVTLIFQNGPRA